MKSRPVLAALCTFTLGGVFYVASHTISEERATAAALQVPPEQVKPNHEKPSAPVMHQLHSKPEAVAKPEGQAKEENTERRGNQARRQELCKKLEQRRAELRAERKAAQAKEAQE